MGVNKLQAFHLQAQATLSFLIKYGFGALQEHFHQKILKFGCILI